jgi:hypothetical protein
VELLEYIIRVRGGRQGREEADQTARGFEHLRRASDEANISSVTLGVGLNSVSGRLQLATTAALFLGPALVSVGASAVGAAIGGGLVAGGGLAMLTAGLGGFAIVAKTFVSGAKSVKTALDAYHLSVAQTGRYSDQSMKALQKLDATVAVSGGAPVLRAVRQWNALGKAFHDATGSSRGSLTGIFTDALGAARKVLPVFASETNKNSRAIRASLRPLFATLSGPEARSGFRSLSTQFRAALGPSSRGATDLFVVLLRALRVAAPYFTQMARAFATWAHSLRATSSDSGKLSGFVRSMVGDFRAWLGLIGATGHLLLTIFRQSDTTGRGLVETLTLGVRRFDAWIASGNRGRGVFRESATLFRDLARAALPLLHVAGTLAYALMPALHSGLGGAGAAFYVLTLRVNTIAAVLRFLGPLAGPIVAAFIAWRLATVALNVALVAMNIAFRLTPLGMAITAITLIAAGFYLAYTRVGWFHRAVDTTFRWIKGHWPLLLAIITGPFGLAVYAVVKHFGSIKRVIGGAIHWIANRMRELIAFFRGAWHAIASSAPGKLLGKIGGAVGAVAGHVPLLAEGGVARSRGMAIVGEAGPELVDLQPGATVSPLSGMRGGDIVLKVDGREWARVTRRQILAAQAGV